MIKKLLFATALVTAFSQQSNAQCTAQVIASTNFVCYGDTAQLMGTPGGTSYQWYNYGFPMPGETNQYFIASTTGDYSVEIDFNGCIDMSTPFTFTGNPIFYINFWNSINNVCMGDTLSFVALPAGGTSPYSYIWTGPNAFIVTTASVTIPNANLTDNGQYHIQVTDANGCQAIDTMICTVTDCDSVWPGDVNWDLVADNNDVLDLALAYGYVGTARTGASNSWVAQYSQTWIFNQFNGANMKHADCNGDSLVDANDTVAISLNYGQTHMKGVHIPQAKSTADPDLYFDLTGVNFIAGTTVNIPIKLGTSTLPMNNILGIAADITVSGITLTTSPTISAATSWMGNNTNLMNFTKGVNANQTDWTLARIDHNNASGNGTIAMLSMDIPAGAAGQDAILYFSNVKIIDNGGNEITNYNVVDDTATVTLSVGTINSPVQYAVVAPNPSEAQASLHLSLAEATNLEVVVSDITGRQVTAFSVKATKGSQEVVLPATQLATGIYNIHIADDKGAVNQNLKWIKK